MKQINLGGTGRMFEYVLNDKTYLFKPAENRFYRTQEEFRAHVCEFASYVQSIVDNNSAIPCKVAKNGNLIGSIQPLYKTNSDFKYDLEDFENGIFSNIEENQLNLIKQSLVREFVVDYLLNNFDCHRDNFIQDDKGIIRGVDKEQSFKYFNNLEAKELSCDYHPNKRYGTLPPIYNAMFKMVREGKLHLDMGWLKELICRVEKIDDKVYMSKAQSYINSIKKLDEVKGYKLQLFILERKTNIRKNIFNFINNLTNDDNKQFDKE